MFMKDDRMSYRSLSTALARLGAGAGMLLLAACAPGKPAAPVATLAPFHDDATPNCVSQEIVPTITEVQPARITPGSEVTLVASGGYLKDSCGGYNESDRTYQVYLDDEPAAELLCYVHRCESRFKLPERAGVGRHCLGVQKGTCQMELVVVGG
jgi:hypothetical protein